MAKKRITELATETTLKDGQYVAIDHTTDGTKKLNLGAELTNLKEDIGDLADLETTDKTDLVSAINEANQNGGTGGITVVNLSSEMIDEGSVYLYNGTETGYTAGHWYFYDTGTSVWTDGGEYTGWETVETALANYLDENAQEMGTLTISVGSSTYTFNGSASVSIVLPVYNGGVS